jgi:hypothetical protein
MGELYRQTMDSTCSRVLFPANDSNTRRAQTLIATKPPSHPFFDKSENMFSCKKIVLVDALFRECA